MALGARPRPPSGARARGRRSRLHRPRADRAAARSPSGSAAASGSTLNLPRSATSRAAIATAARGAAGVRGRSRAVAGRRARRSRSARCSASPPATSSASTSSRCSAASATPRLLFVGENIDAAAAQLGASRARVLDWIALHEIDARRPVRGGAVDARPTSAASPGRCSPRRPSGFPPARSSTAPGGSRRAIRGGSSTRSGPPIRSALLAPAESVATINERPGDDGLGRGLRRARDGRRRATISARTSAALRDGLERRRRDRSLPVRLLSWLLGFELKLRQYERRQALLRRGRRRGRDRRPERAPGSGPETLPTVGELADPDAWIARVLAARRRRLTQSGPPEHRDL